MENDTKIKENPESSMCRCVIMQLPNSKGLFLCFMHACEISKLVFKPYERPMIDMFYSPLGCFCRFASLGQETALFPCKQHENAVLDIVDNAKKFISFPMTELKKQS